MQTINITAHPENDAQIEAIKSALQGLKIKFQISNELQYDPEFVKNILEAEQNIQQGKGIKVTSKEFDELWK